MAVMAKGAAMSLLASRRTMASGPSPVPKHVSGPAWSLFLGVASMIVGLAAGAALFSTSRMAPPGGMADHKLLVLLCAAPALCLINITVVASHDLLAGHRKSVWSGLLLSIVGACAAWAPLLLAD